jgi:hypothetical protein
MKAIGIAAIRLGRSGNGAKQVGMRNCRVAAYLNEGMNRTAQSAGNRKKVPQNQCIMASSAAGYAWR